MAGLRWFKVSADLMRHKKSQALARRLDDERAWAYVVQMWAWFCEQAGNGEQTGPDAAYQIARGAGWKGDVDEFCRHMVAAGFLDAVSEGFRVHDWKEWAGAHVEYQRKDAARKRRVPRTSTPDSGGVPSDVQGNSIGQASECPQECLSTLKSHVSEGGVGGGLRRRGLGAPDSHPLIAAVLAAVHDRGWDADWPKKPGVVEAAIQTATIPVAVDRLMAMVEGERRAGREPKPWLGWHVEVINPKAKQPASGRPDYAAMDYTSKPEL